MKLIDIGINVTNRRFSKDLPQVINRATQAGVEQMVITGTSIHGSKRAAEIAGKYPGILYSTAGVHPHYAQDCNNETIATLEKLAQKEHVVAIGECGLDYNRDFSPRPLQNKWFAAQIELACKLQLPLFLHEREAHDEFINILRDYQQNLPKTVVHCFTGTEKELEHYIEMGYYIGITGWISDVRRGKHLWKIVKKIPENRLMVETDSPFLLPHNMPSRPKNRRNEPSFLPYVVKSLARSLQKSPEEVAELTTNTAKEFFAI
ncbi:TatD family hydrolase [Candidatus Uabimicrobium amorphum]|uniref:Preprotein translocase subunit TatD n=1 Tax=Uabimicrobium amorphum TaxID=2596890 RepID=A0A5S9IND3_UABAM|nr:TatD family hydrolase [Candidatus Uabimicrobium amorphum]BBM84616.1 preprotein translocase subunit TatD [Candidatus Uabimicrobium amorphum]